MRKLTTLTAAFVLVFTVLAFLPQGVLKASALTGKGTKDSPYVVTTYDELYNILSPGDHEFTEDTDTYIKLGNDITETREKSNYYFDIFSNSSFMWTVHFDLAGHTLNRTATTIDSKMFMLGGHCKLIIDDSVGGGVISGDLNCGDQNTALFNVTSSVDNTQLIINGGTIDSLKNRENHDDACIRTFGGMTTINGGTLKSFKDIIEREYGQVYINDGTFIYKGEQVKEDRVYHGLDLGEYAYINSCTLTAENSVAFITLGAGDTHFRNLIPENSVVIIDGTVVQHVDLGTLIPMSSYTSPTLVMGKEIKIKAPIIKEVNLKINEPKAYTVPDFNVTSDNGKVTISTNMQTSEGEWIDTPNFLNWTCGDKLLTKDDIFEYDKTYTANVTLSAKDGYILTTGTKVLINGREAAADVSRIDGKATFRADFTIERKHVDKLDIKIKEPKVGETPDTNIISVTPDDAVDIHVTEINEETGLKIIPNKFFWAEHIDGGAGPLVTKFEKGHTYTAELELTLKEGYRIDEDTVVTVNGVKAKLSEYSNFDGTIYYGADFEPAASKLGDVNDDGKIDIEDAVMVINHVNGQKALTDAESSRADIDGNKNIDIEDAVSIISHVNGVKAIA